jgi:hypothetical protein
MKFEKGLLFIFLGVCIFCGVFIISLGVGSEFTAINKIMSPFICGGDKLEAAWVYNVSRVGPTIFDSRWVCVDKVTFVGRDASLKTNLIAGFLYGLLLFAGMVGWSFWAAGRPAKPLKKQ